MFPTGRMLPGLALLLTTSLSTGGLAQPAPLPLPPPPTGGAPQSADPPARVGQIGRLDGAVSFHAPDAAQWTAATRNFPLIAGDALWTEPRAGVTVDLGGARLALAPSTELGFDRFDPDAVAANEGQGEVCLQVSATPEPQTYTVHTPRGDVAVTQPGRYGILAGESTAPTVVTVLAGAAAVTSGGNTVQLTADQAATMTGADTIDTKVGPARADTFLSAACAAPRSSPAAPPATALMVGAADLGDYGAWETLPSYGEVWYPHVAAGWVPYREGHWAWVAPWGWTWVDDAPWGFAPFHYGRWAEIDRRWGWIPEARPIEHAAPPVYAPALVAFVGLGAAAAGASVGWLPLGPREPFHPWYHTSPAYVRDVNIRQTETVENIQVNNTVEFNRFANRAAATAMPAAAMAASRPVNLVAQTLPPARWAVARPIVGREPLPPTGATQGVTQAVARQLQLPSPASGPTRLPAPGPQIRPAGGLFPPPGPATSLRQAEPAHPVAPAAPIARPGAVPPVAPPRPIPPAAPVGREPAAFARPTPPGALPRLESHPPAPHEPQPVAHPEGPRPLPPRIEPRPQPPRQAPPPRGNERREEDRP